MKYIKLFENCVPVRGYKKSIICDLQNQKFEHIPNDLYDILTDNEKISFEILVKKYGEENIKIIDEYMDFLIKNNFAFYCDDDIFFNFPKLNFEYDKSSIIENAILDFRSKTFSMFSIENYSKVVVELDRLGCKAVMLRFFEDSFNDNIKNILSLFENTKVNHISLLLKHDKNKDEDFVRLLKENLRVFELIIHCSDKEYKKYFDKENIEIIRTKKNINNNSHCGIIHPSLFRINIDVFTESMSYNNCLNKKISIDENGNIKNCPSIDKSYGNIRVDSLTQALNNLDFKIIWNIDKSKIIDCRVCEYRYICQDCRANLPENSNEKPINCKYDPYEGKWNF